MHGEVVTSVQATHEPGVQMNQTIRVYLVDDHTMVRQGLAALVTDQPDMEIVGQCGDGMTAIREARQLKPDVVILDITLPGLNGLDVCRQISRRCKGTSVLVLTMHADEEYVVRSLQNGACGYLLKEAAADQLNQAVRSVAAGELYLGPGISSRVLQRLAEGEQNDPYATLTARERQVLQQIAEGKTNRQVAESLGVSVKTVDTHRTRLMKKLGIHDQTSLVKYALRKGIVRLS